MQKQAAILAQTFGPRKRQGRRESVGKTISAEESMKRGRKEWSGSLCYAVDVEEGGGGKPKKSVE